ncbi:MAG: leucine-rich repeat protein [Bacteroidales bacterium]|nr:leucine-rich repeat protein [Bacteroidales bacterium]
MREINWPEGVTSIERSTFLYCKNLTSFDFPDGLENIGAEAFEGTPDRFRVYIPADLVDSYKENWAWETYADRIEAIPAEP